MNLVSLYFHIQQRNIGMHAKYTAKQSGEVTIMWKDINFENMLCKKSEVLDLLRVGHLISRSAPGVEFLVFHSHL